MSTARILGKRRSVPPAQLKSSELRSAGTVKPVTTAPRETTAIDPKVIPDDDDKESASQEVHAAADASRAKDMREALPAPVSATSFHCGACGRFGVMQPPSQAIGPAFEPWSYVSQGYHFVPRRASQDISNTRRCITTTSHKFKPRRTPRPRPISRQQHGSRLQIKLQPERHRRPRRPVTPRGEPGRKTRKGT